MLSAVHRYLRLGNMTNLNKTRRFVRFPLRLTVIVVMFLLLTVFVMFFVYLHSPQIETFFAFYTNGALFVVYGFVGHNWGECRKCGKNHSHGMLGKKHPNPGFKKGHQINKGRKFTTQHKKNLSISLRLSEVFQKKIRETNAKKVGRTYDRKKGKAKLRKIYKIPEDIQFIPVSVYEHYFARKVLINGGYSRGLITQSQLRERPEWVKNNEDETEVIVVRRHG